MADGSTRGAVLVTGASTGIGRACAEHLDSLGFSVFAGVRKQADAESLRGAGSGAIRPLIIDVTDGGAIAAAADTVAQVAPEGLAGLVNNAGVGYGGPFELVAIDEWRAQMEVNFIGQVAVTQALLPALRKRKGRIVNISSVGGRLATPFLGPYNASKFALEAITDSLRQEMRPFGVEVVAVEPGAVATPIWDKSRTTADQITSRMPAEGVELYGSAIEALRRGMAQAESAGVPALEVAKAVAQALTASRPKTRYVVGRDARMRLAIARLLPTRAMDRLVARVMGI